MHRAGHLAARTASVDKTTVAKIGRSKSRAVRRTERDWLAKAVSLEAKNANHIADALRSQPLSHLTHTPFADTPRLITHNLQSHTQHTHTPTHATTHHPAQEPRHTSTQSGFTFCDNLQSVVTQNATPTPTPHRTDTDTHWRKRQPHVACAAHALSFLT